MRRKGAAAGSGGHGAASRPSRGWRPVERTHYLAYSRHSGGALVAAVFLSNVRTWSSSVAMHKSSWSAKYILLLWLGETRRVGGYVATR